MLKKYPVWSISENGAERDNVGLQFLTIPTGAGTLMPDGTKYADYAVCHNYIYHPNSPGLADNKTWNAADPTSACKVDGLYGNYGLTWARHYRGYSASRTPDLAQGDHGDRLSGWGSHHGGHPRLESPEHVSGSVQAGLELHLRLPPARPHGRRR